MSASIDPDGKNGGPLVETLSSTRAQSTGTFTWNTMPEQLQARGISWKIYSTTDGNAGDNVLTYFKQYQTNPQLAARAFTPTFPGDFHADCSSGLLPQVSWVLAPLAWTEHPPSPPDWGQYATEQVLTR